jgi:hypothetical protein
MTTMHMDVSDTASNRRDQIANFAELLDRAPTRRKVFQAVYRGKRQTKSVREIAAATGFSAKRVTMIAKPLVREKVFFQGRTRIDGSMQTIYRKNDFVESNKAKILVLGARPERLKTYHTKTNPIGGASKAVVIRVPFKIKTEFITIDDIDQFSKVKTVQAGSLASTSKLSEVAMKKGIVKLLGEGLVPKDWGGEINDIFTTRTSIRGRRLRCAFALKGPAQKGALTPKKMGSNGDQIQRLFDSPADVFIVQFEGPIMQSVVHLMEQLAKARALLGRQVYFGIIDEGDTQRLRVAYPKQFVS